MKQKDFWQRGVVSVLTIIGLAIVAVVLPLATKLVKQRQEIRKMAYDETKCADECHWLDGGENWDCGGDWHGCCCKLASDKTICGDCGGNGGGGGGGGEQHCPPGDQGQPGETCSNLNKCDTAGGCNPACCSNDPNDPNNGCPSNQVCDVPNGYCRLGYSCRNPNTEQYQGCVGNQCVWTTEQGHAHCSSDADCGGGNNGGGTNQQANGCPGAGGIVDFGTLSSGPCGGNYGNECDSGTNCKCVCETDTFWHVADASEQAGFPECCSGGTGTVENPCAEKKYGNYFIDGKCYFCENGEVYKKYNPIPECEGIEGYQWVNGECYYCYDLKDGCGEKKESKFCSDNPWGGTVPLGGECTKNTECKGNGPQPCQSDKNAVECRGGKCKVIICDVGKCSERKQTDTEKHICKPGLEAQTLSDFTGASHNVCCSSGESEKDCQKECNFGSGSANPCKNRENRNYFIDGKCYFCVNGEVYKAYDPIQGCEGKEGFQLINDECYYCYDLKDGCGTNKVRNKFCSDNPFGGTVPLGGECKENSECEGNGPQPCQSDKNAVECRGGKCKAIICDVDKCSEQKQTPTEVHICKPELKVQYLSDVDNIPHDICCSSGKSQKDCQKECGFGSVSVNPCERKKRGAYFIDGKCYFCLNGEVYKAYDPPISECKGKEGYQWVNDDECYFCYGPEGVCGYKVENKNCPAIIPTPTPSPAPAPSGWTGKYCSVNPKALCSIGVPPSCSPCADCAGFFGFAHCNDELSGSLNISNITGTVGGSIISNGMITLIDSSGKKYKVKTDQRGNFSLDVPTNKTYKVTVSAPGHKPLTFNWNPIGGENYFSKIKLSKIKSKKQGSFEVKKVEGELLLEGWNLISLTVKPLKTLRASDLVAEINRQKGLVVTVSRWQDGRWQTYLDGLEKNDFEIETGKAYFVENLSETRFSLKGKKIVQPQLLKLKTGWNAVGLPKTVNCSLETCSAQMILNLIDKQLPQSGKVFSQFSSGLWQAVAKDGDEFFGRNFPVNSGRGYFLKVSQPLDFLP